jgi:hypothetical protein
MGKMVVMAILGLRAKMDATARLDRLAEMEMLALQALRVPTEKTVHQEEMEKMGSMALQVLQARMGGKDLREERAKMDVLVPLERMVPRGLQDLEVGTVQLVRRVLKDIMVHRDAMGPMVFPVRQAEMVARALWERMEQ